MSLVGMYQIVTKMPPFCHGRELKVDDTVDNALAQIYSKGYAISDESDGGKISKCRVSIYSEARNIMLWRVVDEEKNVMMSRCQYSQSLQIYELFFTKMPKHCQRAPKMAVPMRTMVLP